MHITHQFQTCVESLNELLVMYVPILNKNRFPSHTRCPKMRVAGSKTAPYVLSPWSFNYTAAADQP